MTPFEKACVSIIAYVEDKPFDGPDRMLHNPSWLDRLDDCLADIRAELSVAAQDDGKWADYLDLLDSERGSK